MPDSVGQTQVLCVDDEASVLGITTRLLRRRYRVLAALSGAEGVRLLKEHADVAVIIADMKMPGMDGAEFLRQAREIAPDAVRMLLTGASDVSSTAAAVNSGQLFRFLVK